MTARVLPRLLEPSRQARLPVSIDDRVVHMLVHFYHFGLPLVQVHRLDLSYMNLKLAVLAGTSQAHEGAEGDRSPSRGLGIAVGALTVVRELQKRLKYLDLLVNVHFSTTSIFVVIKLLSYKF